MVQCVRKYTSVLQRAVWMLFSLVSSTAIWKKRLNTFLISFFFGDTSMCFCVVCRLLCQLQEALVCPRSFASGTRLLCREVVANMHCNKISSEHQSILLTNLYSSLGLWEAPAALSRLEGEGWAGGGSCSASAAMWICACCASGFFFFLFFLQRLKKISLQDVMLVLLMK